MPIGADAAPLRIANCFTMAAVAGLSSMIFPTPSSVPYAVPSLPQVKANGLELACGVVKNQALGTLRSLVFLLADGYTAGLRQRFRRLLRHTFRAVCGR